MRPLLPGAAGCLVAGDQPQPARPAWSPPTAPGRSRLDLLTDAEAARAAGRAGSARAGPPPSRARSTSSSALCARLPLALAIVAARAAARPGFPLAALAAELRDDGRRLDALDAGEPRPTCGRCSPGPTGSSARRRARLFRLLGLHPGPDITRPGRGQPRRRRAGRRPARLLRELARGAPARRARPGPVRLPRPAARLRRRAGPRPRREPDARQAALAACSTTTCTPPATAAPCSTPHASRSPSPRPGPAPPPSSPPDQQAMAWFEAEHHVLLAAVALAAVSGLRPPRLAAPLGHGALPATARALSGLGGRPGAALAAATRLGDIHAGRPPPAASWRAPVLKLGDYDQARAHPRPVPRPLPRHRRPHRRGHGPRSPRRA